MLKILNIKRWTLKRLQNSKSHKLCPLSSDSNRYDINTVNSYILEHFHLAEEDSKYTGRSLKKWWRVSKVKQVLNCSEKQLQRFRNANKLTYIHVSPEIYLYYPQSVKRFAKKLLKI